MYSVAFTLDYRPRIAGGSDYRGETYPLILQIFATHESRPQKPLTLRYGSSAALAHSDVVAPLEIGSSAAQQLIYAPLRDAGAYRNFAQVGRAFEKGKTANSTRVVFNAYATTLSEDGHRCNARVGSAFLRLADLGAIISNSGGATTLDLVQRTGEWPLVKGTLRLSNLRLLDASNRVVGFEQFKRFALLPPQPLEDVDYQQTLLDDLVNCSLLAFTDRSGRAFLQTPTEPFIGRFHCPRMALNTLTAPTFAYLGTKSAKAGSRQYYLVALRHALRRSALTARQAQEGGRQVLAVGARSELAHAFLGFVVRLLTLLATSMPYLDDFTNANVDGDGDYSERFIKICEDMKSARVCGADDCEGTGADPILQAQELSEMSSAAAASESSVEENSNVLGLVARVLRLYVPCLSLFAVTNKKAVPAADLASLGAAVPAHTVGVLVPYRQFERWLSASYSAEQMRSTRYFAARAADLLPFLGADRPLPFLVVDGTARVNAVAILPLGAYFTPQERQDGTSFARALGNLHDLTVLAGQVRKELADNKTRINTEIFSSDAELTPRHYSNETDVSSFYKYEISLQTLAMLELGAADFAFVVTTAHTYGVRFNDVVLLSDTISLVPYLAVTPEEAAIIDLQLGAEEFVPPLEAPTQAPPGTAERAIRRRQGACQRKLASTAAVSNTAATTTKQQPFTGSPGNLLVPRQMVLSARSEDMGENELQAIQNICALESVTGVEINEYRLLESNGVAQAVDIVDITLFF